MIFEGNITLTGTTAKPSTDLASKAFDKARDVESATHIRLKDTNKFIEINNNVVIKRKSDEAGNPTDDIVHYTQINNKEEFVCLIDGVEHPIFPDFYTQIVLMNKNDNGNYLKCDSGVYVHKDEIQIPAYKKINTYENIKIEKPVHDKEFYVETEIVVLKSNGKQITLPNPRVMKDGDKWLYQEDNGEWVEGYYKRDIDTRKYFKHILLDNEKIVDVNKLEERPNGDFVITNVDGEDINVGKKEISLQQPFLEGSSIASDYEILLPHNLLKQRPRIEDENNLAFVWKTPDKNGLVRIDVNKSRTRARFTYADGRQEVYIEHGTYEHIKSGVKEIRIHKLNIIDLGDEGIKLEVMQKKNTFAQDVVFNNRKLESYTLNDRKITNITWQEVDGYSAISSYIIDDVGVYDIVWEDGEIKSCKIHLKDEFGNDVIEQVDDFKSSKYEDLGITYKLTENIEDVEFKNNKFSFKMGDYKFVDVELTEDNNIGKCRLIHNRKEEEINLDTDPRFKQLKLAVKVSLDQSRVIPLVRSRLLEKIDGKYELVADVAQAEEIKDIEYDINGKPTEETKNNGVASAINLQSVSHAISVQDNFKNKPFKTVVIDKNNKTHTLTDFTTTYDGAYQFKHDNDVMVDMVGKEKIEVKKGSIKVDSEKADTLRNNMVTLGFALCSNPLTLVFGIGTLFVGSAVAIAAPISRSITESQLENQSNEELKKAMQDRVAKHCQENINNLIADYKRQLEDYKKRYSQAEFAQKSKELLPKFRYEYTKEVAKLQMLGEGAIQCEFDASKKQRLTPTLHLAYLEYKHQRNIFENGKTDDSCLSAKLKEELAGLKGEDLIEKKIEILQQYGGKRSQIEAHKLKMKNINIFLEYENKLRAKNGQDAISRKDYEKQLEREFVEGKMVWGGIPDKLEAYKASEEYIKADSKKRKTLLKAHKEELESAAKKIKISNIAFEPRLDSKGKPVIEKYTQSAMSYMEVMENMFSTGETKKLPKFSFDFYEKLSAKDNEIYTPTTSLNKLTAQKVSTTQMRRIYFDKNQNQKFTNLTDNKQKQINNRIVSLQQDSERFKAIKDYEQIAKLEISLESEEENFKQLCDDVEDRIQNTPNPELNEEAQISTSIQLMDARVEYEKQKQRVQEIKKSMKQDYNLQVRKWALNEFTKAHKEEYDKYKRQVFKNSQGASVPKNVIATEFFDKMCNNSAKAESYKNELETYKVKHHIEENIEAEAFCELHDEEFKKFVEERSANSLNEEMAKFYFYATCKKENPKTIDNFREYFSKNVKDKAKERVKDNTFIKHDRNANQSEMERSKFKLKNPLKADKYSGREVGMAI